VEFQVLEIRSSRRTVACIKCRILSEGELTEEGNEFEQQEIEFCSSIRQRVRKWIKCIPRHLGKCINRFNKAKIALFDVFYDGDHQLEFWSNTKSNSNLLEGLIYYLFLTLLNTLFLCYLKFMCFLS